MENTYSSPATHSARSKLRNLGFALAIFLLATLLSLSAFVAYLASRIPPRSSPNPVIHPMIIDSPFTLHRGNISQAARNPLGIPVHAGAIPLEVSTFGWGVDHPSAPPTPAGLVLVRFEVKDSFPSVSTWYHENFPKPYSLLRKQEIRDGLAKEPWFEKLDVSVNNDTVLYQAVDSDGIRGAIIQPGVSSDSSAVTIFRYSEAR